MDRYALYALIPVSGIFFTGLIVFSFTRLGRALANRLEGRPDGSTEARLAALEMAHEEMGRALAEAHERLEFAERALIRDSHERIDTPV